MKKNNCEVCFCCIGPYDKCKRYISEKNSNFCIYSELNGEDEEICLNKDAQHEAYLEANPNKHLYCDLGEKFCKHVYYEGFENTKYCGQLHKNMNLMDKCPKTTQTKEANMKIKHIKFNTPDGIYAVKLETIARQRAIFYRISEGSDTKTEIDYVMNNGYDGFSEGITWMLMNMEYEDIEDVTFKIDNQINVTTDDFWEDYRDFEIIELEAD